MFYNQSKKDKTNGIHLFFHNWHIWPQRNTCSSFPRQKVLQVKTLSKNPTRKQLILNIRYFSPKEHTVRNPDFYMETCTSQCPANFSSNLQNLLCKIYHVFRLDMVKCISYTWIQEMDLYCSATTNSCMKTEIHNPSTQNNCQFCTFFPFSEGE